MAGPASFATFDPVPHSSEKKPHGGVQGCLEVMKASCPAQGGSASGSACLPLTPPCAYSSVPHPRGVCFMDFQWAHKDAFWQGPGCNSLGRARLWVKPASPLETHSSDKMGSSPVLSLTPMSLPQPSPSLRPFSWVAQVRPAAPHGGVRPHLLSSGCGCWRGWSGPRVGSTTYCP